MSMTLIALVLAGATAALIQGNRMIEDARDQTRVSQVIQSEVEALRTMNWEDLQAKTYSDDALSHHIRYELLPLQGQFAEKYSDRYRLWRGMRVEPDNDEQIGVFIWVGWNPPRGHFKWQRFYTRFTKEGLNDYYYRAF